MDSPEPSSHLKASHVNAVTWILEHGHARLRERVQKQG